MHRIDRGADPGLFVVLLILSVMSGAVPYCNYAIGVAATGSGPARVWHVCLVPLLIHLGAAALTLDYEPQSLVPMQAATFILTGLVYLAGRWGQRTALLRAKPKGRASHDSHKSAPVRDRSNQ